MSLESALLPDGVSAAAVVFVVFSSFLTSALTAAFGLGGGLALLAVMGAMMPPAAVIPVHGIAQLGSNASRLALQWRSVVWPIVLWFSAGSLIGAVIGARLFVELPESLLKALIGAFVLLTVYGPKPRGFSPGARTFFATGAASAIISMFVGATGPIAAAMVGGMGNPIGAILGGLIVGLLEAFSAGYLSSTYKDAVAFIVILAVLFAMPGGLLGRASVERV